MLISKIVRKLKNRQKTKKQYSKVWMSRWQFFVMFWLSVFFVIDIYYNQGEHLLELCITLVTSIVATLIPYFAKSYFETKEEEKNKMLKEQFEEGVNEYEGQINQ